jgi:hypothetical protein
LPSTSAHRGSRPRREWSGTTSLTSSVQNPQPSPTFPRLPKTASYPPHASWHCVAALPSRNLQASLRPSSPFTDRHPSTPTVPNPAVRGEHFPLDLLPPCTPAPPRCRRACSPCARIPSPSSCASPPCPTTMATGSACGTPAPNAASSAHGVVRGEPRHARVRRGVDQRAALGAACARRGQLHPRCGCVCPQHRLSLHVAGVPVAHPRALGVASRASCVAPARILRGPAQQKSCRSHASLLTSLVVRYRCEVSIVYALVTLFHYVAHFK